MQWKCLTIDFERQRDLSIKYVILPKLRPPGTNFACNIYIYIYIYVYKKVGEGFQMWLRHWYVNVFNQGCRGSTANFEEVCEIKIP